MCDRSYLAYIVFEERSDRSSPCTDRIHYDVMYQLIDYTIFSSSLQRVLLVSLSLSVRHYLSSLVDLSVESDH